MTPDLAEPGAEGLAAAQLHSLQADLAGRGFLTVWSRNDGTLTLQVTSQATGSSVSITIAADDSGAWWFLWSWGDRISLVDDVETAAFKIAYVLTPQPGG